MRNNFNELIQQKNNQMVTTSINVAKVFNKKHKNVMQNIENLVAENSAAKNMFAHGYHINRGRKYPMFYMNRDGFSFVVMSFTGKKANSFKIAYIQAFNSMENQLKQSNPLDDILNQPKSEIFKLASRAAAKYEKAKPKADYYDNQMRNPGLITTTIIAKDYGMGARKLNNILHNLGVIYKRGNSWILYAKYQDQDLAGYEDVPFDDNCYVHSTLKWTQRGKAFIHNVLCNEMDMIPQSEQMILNQSNAQIAMKRER